MLAALGVTPAELRRELAWAAGRADGNGRLSDDELDAVNGTALPDREVMSILSVPDPAGGVVLPLPPGDVVPGFGSESADA